jgi:hypothetical protein
VLSSVIFAFHVVSICLIESVMLAYGSIASIVTIAVAQRITNTVTAAVAYAAHRLVADATDSCWSLLALNVLTGSHN